MSDDKPKMIFPKPKEFMCKLSMCGLDTMRHNYKVSKSDSALALSVGLIKTFTDDFVGEESSPNLQYDVAIALLQTLTGVNIKDVEKHLQIEPQKLIDGWKR